MSKWIKLALGLAVPGVGGVAAMLLGGGDGLLDAAKDVGVVLIVKGAIEDLLSGPALAFARFQVLAGVTLLGGLVALHFWRGESWAGKVRVAWWLWCGVGGVAALLVVSGIVDSTMIRIRHAERRSAELTETLRMPEPERREVRRKLKTGLLLMGPSGRSDCAGCE